MTANEQREYLYGEFTPELIPFEVVDNRLLNLQLNLEYLAKAEKLDLARINEVQDAIKFWSKIL